MDDVYFMRQALQEAQKAFDIGEVPVGAIITARGKIIARAHNLTEQLTDVTAHAEMQAFTAAAQSIGGKYLAECTLYVTLEPCFMCAGAAYWTQIGRIVFGAADQKRGFQLLNHPVLHPRTTLISGVLEKECADLLLHFFQKRRDTTG
ncbi:MAG: nucleoside deaminase [Bacteroidales bacterium]|nr:nucleoside deaminase [Bacteroidales bacterium]